MGNSWKRPKPLDPISFRKCRLALGKLPNGTCHALSMHSKTLGLGGQNAIFSVDIRGATTLKTFLINTLVICLALMAVPASAATCKSLAGLELANATITIAQTVDTGSFVLPPESRVPSSDLFSAFSTLRAFCRVQGVIRTSSDSHIEFEVWLPASDWNGKYEGAGNGGFGGSINYYRLAEAVNAGYAGSSTDTGHKGSSGDRSWSLGHPEKVIDFDYRAVHETAEQAKAVIRAFLARPPNAPTSAVVQTVAGRD
jgi:hypothetical protein